MELETYKQTRQGLDEMYNVVWKQYKEEKRIRQVRYQHAIGHTEVTPLLRVSKHRVKYSYVGDSKWLSIRFRRALERGLVSGSLLHV